MKISNNFFMDFWMNFFSVSIVFLLVFFIESKGAWALPSWWFDTSGWGGLSLSMAFKAWISCIMGGFVISFIKRQHFVGCSNK